MNGSVEALSGVPVRNLLVLLAPIAPHLCEEIWERIGHRERRSSRRSCRGRTQRYLKAETYTLVVQVNGKIRSRIDVEKDTPRRSCSEMALADEKVAEVHRGRKDRQGDCDSGKPCKYCS